MRLNHSVTSGTVKGLNIFKGFIKKFTLEKRFFRLLGDWWPADYKKETNQL